MKPRAREQDLIVSRLDGETLVYDVTRHRAYCLNRTAAEVWQLCDGRRDVAALARRLAAGTETPPNQELVRLALERLTRARLLMPQRDAAPPGPSVSRREMIRRAGVAALLPVVASVVVPSAALS